MRPDRPRTPDELGCGAGLLTRRHTTAASATEDAVAELISIYYGAVLPYHSTRLETERAMADVELRGGPTCAVRPH